MSDRERTRRQAVRRAAALGGAALAAAAVPVLARPGAAPAQEADDATALGTVLSLQQTVMVAYDTLASGGLLEGRAARLAGLLLEHEREHVRALAEALEEAGGAAPQPPSPRGVEGLAELRSPERALEFAIDLETRAVAAAFDAAGQLDSGAALLTVAAVMASDAQHLVLLRQAAGQPPLPEAFVMGTPVG